jgi:hypothetical protein
MWRHTWRKNWVKCAVLTGNSAGFRTVPFQSSLTHRTAQFTQGIPQFPQFTCPTPRWHHLKSHPFLTIHLADEHRMIHSFSNTTSYSTFYAFFSSFRKELWPMWLANDSLVFIHRSHTHKKTHRTDKKNDKPLGKPVLCQRTFSSVSRAVSYTVKLHSLT